MRTIESEPKRAEQAKQSWVTVRKFFRRHPGLLKVVDYVAALGLDQQLYASTSLSHTLSISPSHRHDAKVNSISVTAMDYDLYEVTYWKIAGSSKKQIATEPELMKLIQAAIHQLIEKKIGPGRYIGPKTHLRGALLRGGNSENLV